MVLVCGIASGCGKTTLLRMLIGVLQPTSGQILLDGAELPPSIPPVGVLPGIKRKPGIFWKSFRTKSPENFPAVSSSGWRLPAPWCCFLLGLAYVLLFKGSFLYGTLLILVMVNIVHFFSSPYLMMYNAFPKINENMETVIATLKISRFRLLVDILLPKCTKTIAEMVSYFFINYMMTISAVFFLANIANKPVALMINQFEAQAQMESAAVVSLLILAVNQIAKAVTERK